jgi:hypothetical protein
MSTSGGSQSGGPTGYQAVPTPPVSGTPYLNNTTKTWYVYIPVTFNPTAGASAGVNVTVTPNLGTVLNTYSVIVPLGVINDGTVQTIMLVVPPDATYTLTTTNATIGAAVAYS